MSSNRPTLKIANSYSRTRMKNKSARNELSQITNYFSPARKPVIHNVPNNVSPKLLTNGIHEDPSDTPSSKLTRSSVLSSPLKEEVKLENGVSTTENLSSSVCTRSQSQKMMANLALCDTSPQKEQKVRLCVDVKGLSLDNDALRQTTPPLANGLRTPPEGSNGEDSASSSPHTGPPTPHKIQALNEAKLRLDSPLSSSINKLKIISPRKIKFSKPISNAKRKQPNQTSIPVGSNASSVSKTGATEKPSKPALNGALKTNSKPAMKNTQMTQFFPIRRSHRKPKAILIQEKQKDIEEKILSGKEEGLDVECFHSKGRGVKTTRFFRKGEMVVEYVGDLIDMKESKEREKKYSQDTSKGCYMYYFTYQNTQYCIDATEESGYLGRLVNHSRNGNLATKTVEVNGKPHLILLAKKDLEAGTEILYDYGDRSKQSLEHHPWLAL